MKRLLDVVLASVALVALAPVLAVAALGIRRASPGPILYRAARVGRHGRLFTMYKLRTMHVAHGGYRSAVTAAHDPRVFPFGAWLRRLKVDELPQLVNVLRGEMSIVGPRPEDPTIVSRHYTPLQRETLAVRPGLASPGSIYSYTHGEHDIPSDDPEGHYVAVLLPVKLALDVVYVRRASLGYDVAVILRTLWALGCIALGRRRFADPSAMAAARRFIATPPRLRRRLVPARETGM